MRTQVLLVFNPRFEECAAMLRGIAHYQHSHQPWEVFLDGEAKANGDPSWVRSKKWNGVISRHTSPELVRTCVELGLPLVDLSDTPPIAGVPKIRPDNQALGRRGAEYFLDCGYRHFGFCGYENLGWARERQEGFTRALQGADRDCHIFDIDYQGDLTPQSVEQQAAALAQWLHRLPEPVAVMACDDLRAFQVVNAARAAGLLVPEDVAVLGTNNSTLWCELADPQISSVATDSSRAGYLGAEYLARLMAGENPGIVDLRVEPVGVVTRKSTNVLSIADNDVTAAVSYIRDHACENITVDDVLKNVFVSRSKLEKKFRQCLGRSPQAEIRRVQLAKIRELLIETDYPLKRIAELTGFEYVEYMNVLFKRLVGESPGRYRRKNKPMALLTERPLELSDSRAVGRNGGAR